MPLQLEIVTPERLAFSDTVDAVQLPGAEGEMGVLPHHAPLLATLGVGELRIRKGGEAERALESGFQEEADLSAARAALQTALLRIRLAERRHREGPRRRV